MMTIQEVKTIQISDFLADKGYKPINKKGYKWWYLSPLHTEQTASFKVDLNKNLWYDFGLGKGGNIIDLAMALFHTQNISEVLHRMSHSIIMPAPPVKLVSSSETTPFKDVEVKELAHPALLNYLYQEGLIRLWPKVSAWKYTTKVVARTILPLDSGMMLVATNYVTHTSKAV